MRSNPSRRKRETNKNRVGRPKKEFAALRDGGAIPMPTPFLHSNSTRFTFLGTVRFRIVSEKKNKTKSKRSIELRLFFLGLPSVNGFLPSFTGFYLVSLGFT